MKKIILFLLLSVPIFAQVETYDNLLLFPNIYRGLLFASGEVELLSTDNLGMSALGGRYTLTQTGAQVQTILNGAFGSSNMSTTGTLSSGAHTIGIASPLLTLYDSDNESGAAVDTSALILEANGEPSIEFNASDADEANISINTADQLLFNNGTRYIFDNIVYGHIGDAGGGMVPPTGTGICSENSSHGYISLLVPENYIAAILFGNQNDNDIGQVRYLHNGDHMVFMCNTAEVFRLSPGGIADVSGYLTVDDSILVGGSKLDVPDYVFEDDYEQLSIGGMKEFYTENKHLPTMPSGDSFGEKVNIMKFNLRMLETLEVQAKYIVELEERIARLENK